MNEIAKWPLRGCLSKIIDYRGKTPKKLGGDWSDKGFRAISANNVKFDGLVELDSIRCLDSALYKKWMKDEVQSGDLFLTSEAPAGQVLLWMSDEKIVLSQRLYALRTNDSVNNKYLKYFLQSEIGQNEIAKNCSGSTVFGISEKMFDLIQVLVPDLDQQTSIGELLYLLDAKIELNNRINHELEALAKTIYDYWFVQFDFPDANGRPYRTSGGKMTYNPQLKREIPAGWKAATLGDIAKNVIRASSLDEMSPNMPYVGLEHMPRKSIALTDWGDSSQVESNKSLFEKGEFLFGKLRPYFHKVGIAPVNGVCSTDILIIAPKSQAWYGFVLDTISSDDFVKYATRTSAGTKMPRTNWNSLARYPVALPQKEIAERFTGVFKPVAEQVRINILQNRHLVTLRDWLLPMLMNGQVTIE